MKNKLLMFVFLLVPFSSMAVQRLTVKGDHQISAHVAAHQLNRIAVDNDKITNVKGLSGQFELDKDEMNGQIFIKPSLVDASSSINLFVTTEKGHTYSIKLIVDAKNAESILIIPNGESMAAKWEQTNAYDEVVKNIIVAMHNQESLEGYAVEKLNNKLPNKSGLEVHQVQSYVGDKLTGLVLEVVNAQNESLRLEELEFCLPNVRAVAIAHKDLAAKARTYVYLVRSLV